MKKLIWAEKSGNFSCPDGFVMKPTLGKCYLFNPDAKSWDQARDRCKILGADLATPQNRSGARDRWIGRERARERKRERDRQTERQ